MPPKKRPSDVDGEGGAKKSKKSGGSANGADIDDGTVYPAIVSVLGEIHFSNHFSIHNKKKQHSCLPEGCRGKN